MTNATKQLAKKIAADLKSLDRKSPPERMAAYLAVGCKLRGVVECECTYGSSAVADLASCLPHLRTEVYAYRVMRLSECDEEERAFILEQTAAPMDNGQHLTPGHWMWVFRACWPDTPAENEERFRRELEWLRRESPSEASLEHVAQVLDARHGREMEELRAQAREAYRFLDAL